MADSSPPASSSSGPPRPKPIRSTTTVGTVRGRTSPTGDQNPDGRPPTKRARKAINCEPCRNSKLKCDRNRPCSSCVLRGTSALCYQDGRGHEGTEANGRGDDTHVHRSYGRIDPAQEITRLRHSINLLEAYIFPGRSQPPHPRTDPSALVPKKESVDHDVNGKAATPGAAPGILGNSGGGGLYAGPTSAATQVLLTSGSRGSEETDGRQPSHDQPEEYVTPEYDRDLLAMLPSIEVIDDLIAFYFDYCNWIYRHVNQPAFLQQWTRFKTGQSADRITLATACVMLAIAVFFLPARHPLLEGFSETHEELGNKFYQVSTTSLARRLAESKAYSLELIEMYLIRGHFQTLSKTDQEEIWHIRGELVSIGMAMGLHRDPGKWKMHRDIAERRRWAWWHIILLERWQAFMFGRPLAIASHHFDTQLPSYCDPTLDKSGRLYHPNIHLFKLAYILGDIVDDAVSVQPVPYDSVQRNDRALTQWMEELPPELDLDEYRVARSLASSNIALQRLGVQSIALRAAYYHIRFTLHRPYVTSPSQGITNGKSIDPAKSAQSLEIAVSSAEKLITLVGQSRPDFLANSSLAVPGHMNWQPFHCFSAAMFFSFQLTSNPDQPGAGLFRTSIRKAMATLEQSRGNAVADKALDILQALSPLYAADFPNASREEREKLRQQVFSTVRKLAFPYHGSHDPRRSSDSPSARGIGSPSASNSVSPPLASISAMPQHYESMHNMSAMRGGSNGYPTHQALQSPSLQMSSTILGPPPHVATSPSATYQAHSSYGSMSHQQQMYPDSSRYTHYVNPMDEMWGAAVGFAQGEWTHFENAARHIQGP